DEDGDEDEGEMRRRQPRNGRGRREEANGRAEARESDAREDREDGDSEYEPAENPFKPAVKPTVKPRAERRPRRTRSESTATDDGEIDASALPPAIGEAAEGEAPKKKRVSRARKAAEPAED